MTPQKKERYFIDEVVDQAQEHHDHIAGQYANEAQAAYDLCRRDQPADARTGGEGMFLLKVETPHFCAATDAFVGCVVLLAHKYATLAEAVAAQNNYLAETGVTEEEARQCDIDIRIQDFTPVVHAAEDALDEDIPF